MKAIDIAHAEIGIVTSRPDNSVSFKVITPEVTTEQAATLIGMHGKNARVTVIPIDSQVTGVDEVTTERDQKTPCQRLRGVLFVHFREAAVKGDFESFYRTQMDKIIEGYKAKNLPQ